MNFKFLDDLETKKINLCSHSIIKSIPNKNEWNV